jgi:preprotein translocase subunit YajC
MNTDIARALLTILVLILMISVIARMVIRSEKKKDE